MSVETYKKQIIDLRARLDREKEAKKKDNERYAGYIKSASTPSSKASYRKSTARFVLLPGKKTR